jgi:hypothetical protein
MSVFSNYTLQDIFGILLGFLFFSMILVAPGYVFGWSFNLFDFRLRRPLVRFQIGLIVSIAISPILFFLSLRFFPAIFTYAIVIFIVSAFFTIIYRNGSLLDVFSQDKQDPANKHIKYALWIGIGWVTFIILMLIEFHVGDRLYYNVVAHDYSTRVAIINAITRTGVPPVNPGYFPGHSVYLTYLYYFWYVLCSLVDQLGGGWVDARIAMTASVIWCGLALMATIAFYLRLRSPRGGIEIWRSAFWGIGLIFISGADVIPIFLISFIQSIDYLGGDIEHWNEQITAWIGSLSWVPHHVAAMIACLVGVMLLFQSQHRNYPYRIKSLIVAGLAFASAFGLSVFVTMVFAIFWGIWLIIGLIQKDWRTAFLMLLSGLVGLITISPFLVDLLLGNSSNNSSDSTFVPFSLAVRSFWPVGIFIQDLPRLIRNLIYLTSLPLNYFLELGFFFIVGLLWLHLYKKGVWNRNPFFGAEIVVLMISVVIGSFVRSTVISSNDIGWRAWLPGQFILLIWGVDIIERFFSTNPAGSEKIVPKAQRMTFLLNVFLIIGLLTTLVNITLLRTWPLMVDSGVAKAPNSFSPDAHLGQRTLASRQMYDFINQNLVQDAVIQINPTDQVDRTIGLYANRQVAVSVHTAFGIPQDELRERISSVANIFEQTDWQPIDQSCKTNFINALIINDLDPLWKNMEKLESQRTPFYKNQYFAVFLCGE